MDTFLAILLLTSIGILATTRAAYRLRRRRSVASFVSGGWFSLAVGFAIGPAGFDLVSREAILQTIPLIAIGLGWIGFIVGFQLRGAILRDVPGSVWRIVIVDALVTLIAAAVCIVGFRTWAPEAAMADLLLPVAFIFAASLGWSLETRSLGADASPRLAMHIRAAGALLSVAAIVAFGVAAKVVERDGAGVMTFTLDRALLKTLHTLLLAVAVGLLGRYMIRLAGERPGHQLAVFLGLLAFTAGSAKQLDVSPLLSAMLAGVVIANLHADGLRRFESFIIKGEHAIGVFFGLLVGVLIDPRFVVAAPVLIALGLLVFRMVVKQPAAFAAAHDVGSAPDRRRLGRAVIRQSPLMLALAVSLVLIEPSVFHKQLAAMLVITGVLAEAIASLFVPRASRRDPSDRPTEAAT